MCMSRAMGFTEYYSKFCHDHTGGTTNLVGIAGVNGPLSEEVLRRALVLMSECHPALRAFLVESPQGDALIEIRGHLLHIPLEIKTKVVKEDWTVCFEESLQADFADGEVPWRVTLLQDGKNGGVQEIVAAFHHSLSDGISLATFFGGLLECCRLIIEEREPKTCRLMPLPALEKMLCDRMSWPAFLARKTAVSTMQTLRLRKHFRPYERPVSLQDRKTRVLPCELDPELLEQLVFICRHRGTTLSGLLTAALMISVYRNMDGPANRRASKQMAVTPVSLRQRCEPEVGLHQLGCYVGFAQTTHVFDAGVDVWELACSFNRVLERCKRRGILPPQRFSRKSLDKMLRSLEKGIFKDVFHYGVGVTNIGRLPYSPDFGEIHLESFYFGTSRRWGDWLTLLHCSTLEGKLFLNFCYAEPLLSPGSIADIADGFLSMLRSLAR